MKTTKFITALIAIFGFAFLSTLESCKKDEDPAVAATKTQLISKDGWVLKSAVLKFGTQTFDTYAQMDECEKDDILFLKSDKTVVLDAGSIKCDPTDPQIEDGGIWAFGSTESKLVITEGNDITELDITSLSSTEMTLEFSEFDSTLQTTIEGTFTYKH